MFIAFLETKVYMDAASNGLCPAVQPALIANLYINNIPYYSSRGRVVFSRYGGRECIVKHTVKGRQEVVTYETSAALHP